jgi:myo-inositol 2-dehydrogenase/D-chiro-inositol 1-dehydrogenase
MRGTKMGSREHRGRDDLRRFDEMLGKENLDAVIVASVIAAHAEQTLKAIEEGLHVLCEKPLSIDVQIVS